MFRFIVATLAILSVFADKIRPKAKDPTFDCIVNYLQSKNLLDNGFPKVRSNSMCKVILNATVTVELRQINETVAQDNKVDRECLLTSLKQNHFEEEVYKKMVYEQATHLSEAAIEEKLTVANQNYTEFIINRTAECLDTKKCLKMLCDDKEFFEDFSASELFCATKFVTSKNLVDLNDYKIHADQKSDSSRNDCNEKMLKLRTELNEMFTKDLLESQKECFVGKTEDAQVFENLIWIKVLIVHNATDSLMEKEQRRFDEFFPNFFRNFTLCQS